jgi:hypothetical protein
LNFFFSLHLGFFWLGARRQKEPESGGETKKRRGASGLGWQPIETEQTQETADRERREEEEEEDYRWEERNKKNHNKTRTRGKVQPDQTVLSGVKSKLCPDNTLKGVPCP